MYKRLLLHATLIVLSALGLTAILTSLQAFFVPGIPPEVLFFSRWLFIASLCLYGLKKHSLTTWILISMVIGAEIRHDWPAIADDVYADAYQ